MKKLLLIVLPLLLIVGCDKPVEESTLIEFKGLMYLPNTEGGPKRESDTPYSGEVFTNYDSGEKLYTARYQNGLLIDYSYLNKDGSLKNPVNGETLIERRRLFYEPNGQEPYSGEVFTLHDNGNRKISTRLKNGKYDGLYTEFYENGEKKHKVTYKYGKKHGKHIMWYDNGKIKFDKTYNNGKFIYKAMYNYDGSFLGESYTD